MKVVWFWLQLMVHEYVLLPPSKFTSRDSLVEVRTSNENVNKDLVFIRTKEKGSRKGVGWRSLTETMKPKLYHEFIDVNLSEIKIICRQRQCHSMPSWRDLATTPENFSPPGGKLGPRHPLGNWLIRLSGTVASRRRSRGLQEVPGVDSNAEFTPGAQDGEAIALFLV